MRIGAAIAAAAEWVKLRGSSSEGFKGAYISGSTVGKSDEEEVPAASDVDVVVVVDQETSPSKLGKILYRGTLLEITYLPWHELSSAEEVLASYHLAGSFRWNTILADPTGQLSRLQQQVSRHFAERRWVRRRCENARLRVENGLRYRDAAAPWHDQVTSWLFPTGVTTHVLLVAALRNPTVRLRYLAAREALGAYGLGDVYPDLLELLGCARMTPQRAGHHLGELARTFDAAAARARTPFFFSSDIAPAARPVAIDGSLELIRTGCHREAVFWMAATFARCHQILAADAPELGRSLAPAFDALMADLGITSRGDLDRLSGDVLLYLPKLWDTAEAIMAANPDIL
ncbi:hypothetical protein COLU111180_20165 [Cohnella lubricantis]|uniref:Polymerase nucleotidyl transferase domain-containing protein n=1 Tax=Cohnella lubricantis TaxID=2163172 RepID=A0A841TCA8_9BACL|nr:hypothetical protein [Cohnella lubricantis]MBB6679103.1 hypothetical protein [Cohnella lubricantis]MBP2119655.1 hypothetical protein [Cohnella lubricantis]